MGGYCLLQLPTVFIAYCLLLIAYFLFVAKFLTIMKNLYPCIFLSLLAAACEPSLIAEFQDKAVVESYLYAGSFPQVKVSKLIPFRDDVSYSEEDVDKLSITITDEASGSVVTLQPQGGGMYADSSFTIQAGRTYTLSLPYNSESVSAATTIPDKPVGMAISKTTISAMSPPHMVSLVKAADDREPAVVSWTNADNSYYMVVVENVESNPTSIYDWDEEEEDRPKFMFKKEPTQAAEAQLSQQDFSYYGRHNVILVKMQPEYALLYQTQSNTSESVSEIHANVSNGYGIFTGLNSDTLQVNVVQSSGL